MSFTEEGLLSLRFGQLPRIQTAKRRREGGSKRSLPLRGKQRLAPRSGSLPHPLKSQPTPGAPEGLGKRHFWPMSYFKALLIGPGGGRRFRTEAGSLRLNPAPCGGHSPPLGSSPRAGCPSCSLPRHEKPRPERDGCQLGAREGQRHPRRDSPEGWGSAEVLAAPQPALALGSCVLCPQKGSPWRPPRWDSAAD